MLYLFAVLAMQPIVDAPLPEGPIEAYGAESPYPTRACEQAGDCTPFAEAVPDSKPIRLGTPEAADLYRRITDASDRWASCIDREAVALANGKGTSAEVADAAFGLCKLEEIAAKNVFFSIGGDERRLEEIWTRRMGETKASLREVVIGTIAKYRIFIGQ